MPAAVRCPGAPPGRRRAQGRVAHGKGRSRGQVQGLDWRAADLARAIAPNGGGSLAGLCDSALIQVMSNALLRVSEAAALDVADVANARSTAAAP